MSHDTLAIIWFGLWGLIWTVYFILDGYTLGTGMLFPFIAKNRQERNQLQEAVGPFWGGNEVWLITAGGATFAAFPAVYADMFSFLYTPLFLVLIALFIRAIGLEFMHKDDNPLWQATCKWGFFTGSFLIAFLFGVTFANLYRGLLIGVNGYEGNLFSLLNGYGILGGLLFVSLFILSGSLWIQLKTAGQTAVRAYRLSRIFAGVAPAMLSLFFLATVNRTPLLDNYSEYPVLWIVPVIALTAMLAAAYFIFKKKIGYAFTAVCVTIFTKMAFGFVGMFPNMLPSRLDNVYSVTLFDAAGSKLNLTIMFVVAVIFVPIIIAYQSWSYTLFKDKILKESAKGYQ
ncbi:cytochrome d ubiquinol oxidase subunit II [Mesobacillus selenatarsenatis]|uniref:Cytochrome d ubiquinol oxidase subunit II n=1 Tax=Mesobacillus selenatarsenatis (strain DSM 18680 / JCM 14380 / FERM P-15431 / SF-1) TaxID=1321606 RepID=A0A0A8X3T7_MESS1|nr:cytochrome d ubiquinol oxidase subunit II [Mesobacillus selenatarsenatis]GAM14603.1 cytochrome d ubiquinol oxidase subunit II [Mesobacillus selenatarsenatis SF-1]